MFHLTNSKQLNIVSQCKTVQLKNVVVSLIDEDHIDQVINRNLVLILKTAH